MTEQPTILDVLCDILATLEEIRNLMIEARDSGE